MSKTILDITMSLDGFIAGPGITPDHPLGKEGQRLHDWLFSCTTPEDERVVAELMDTCGAVILGDWTYTVAIDTVWDHVSPFFVPAFVLCTEHPAFSVRGFSFITGGIRQALQEARAVSKNKHVWVMGGAHTAQQFLRAGLLDELHVHIVPLLLARGTRLFDDIGRTYIELRKLKVIVTAGAIHAFYEVETRPAAQGPGDT